MTSPEPELKPTIAIAQSQEVKQKIYRLRYAVYVEEMAKKPSYADHSNKFLVDELDQSGYLLYAEIDGEIVASVRFNIVSEASVGEFLSNTYQLPLWLESWPAQCLSLTSRLVLQSQWRGSAVLGKLLLALYALAREKDVHFNFINCSPGLVEFYEQIGYWRFGEGFVDPDVGYHVPMVLPTQDHVHLSKVRSFCTRLSRTMPSTDKGTLWFKEKFPEYAAHINHRTISSENFWVYMEDRLHDLPEKSLGLLSGLSKEEARAFLDTGTVLPCKSGSTLIRPGDVGNEMFVVLEGVVEVWSADRSVSLAILGPGEVFGEMAFVSKSPRTAHVIARTDVQVLILTQSIFKRATKKIPEIVAKVLLNLSVVLVARLRSSTQSWVDSVSDKEFTGEADQ